MEEVSAASMQESLKSLITERVEIVDSQLSDSEEYSKRNKILSKIEDILIKSGKPELYAELDAALLQFEYKLSRNAYLQCCKDKAEIHNISLI